MRTSECLRETVLLEGDTWIPFNNLCLKTSVASRLSQGWSVTISQNMYLHLSVFYLPYTSKDRRF